MAQNNSVFDFVWKTSNDSRGRPNLRINMNEVTDLKSWGFTRKMQQIYFDFLQVFYPPISAIVRFVVDGVARLVFVSVVVEADG